MPAPIVTIFEGAYDEHILLTAEKLRIGGVVVLPSDTVYLAAGLINHETAKSRLQALRGSAASDSPAFTIHLGEPATASRYLGVVSDLGKRCMRKLWPGPVTLIFDVPGSRRAEVAQSMALAPSDLYHDDLIALRCPDQIVARDVLNAVEGPVGAVVAGKTELADGRAAAELLGDKVDLVLDAGPPRFSKPSTILRVRENRYEIVRTGIYDQRIIEKLLRTTILFVCSGNTCRSPMAEAITRHLLSSKLNVPEEELDKKGISVLSAGAMAYPGSKATGEAVDAVREMGGDLSRHRSRSLSVELIHQADMIFAMSPAHARIVTAMVPAAVEKVSLLDPAGEIEDPIGGDFSLYRELAGQMRDLIEKRLQEHALP